MGSKALWEAKGSNPGKSWIVISFTSHNLRPILFQTAKKEAPDPYSNRGGCCRSDQGIHFQSPSFSFQYPPLRRFLLFLSRRDQESHGYI